MCELFALNANTPTAATFSFAGLSARGGLTGDHVDGFGLGFHDGEGCRMFIDETRAATSPVAELLRRHPIRAGTVIGHVRKATQGRVALVNCHPFQREWAGRHWLFAHNGDLKDFAPPLDGSELPVGQTDSELAFCWLLQQLRARFRGGLAPEGAALGEVLAPWLARIAAHGTFNLLLTDGRTLVAHASTRLAWLGRAHPFGTARLVDRDLEVDLSAANGPGDRMVLVATAPLTVSEPWQPFAAGEMRAFMQGRCVWSRPGRQPASAASTDARIFLADASVGT